MSFLGFLFGPSKRKRKVSFSDKSKLNRRDIVDLVWSVESLDSKQKKLVERELIAQLDDGGVSKWEYKEIIRQLSIKRRELGLSEIDIKNLKKIL
jgi:hypothetical protein